MGKTFAILGLGKFGGAVARELSSMGFDVIAVDINETLVKEIQHIVSYAAIADVTNKEALIEIGVGEVDACFISMADEVESSLMAALIVKELGVKNIIAKASSKMHGKLLEKIGVNRVVFPEREMGIRVAKSIIAGNFLDMIDLSSKYSLVELDLPSKWVGKSISEINVRKNYGVNIVALKTKDEILINIPIDRVFLEEDVIVVIGSGKAIGNLGDD